MLAFLCGGMEYSTDGGRQWRERVRLWLQENLNHRVYDPTVETRRVLNEEEGRNFREWKLTDLDRFRRVMRIVINHDVDVMTNQADYVVCLWDDAAKAGGGTHAELTAAYRKGIPVYMVAEMPVEEISGWVVACSTKIFSGFNELKSHLAATYGKEAQQRALWGAR
ncbi:MAG TPA: hypothetical protein VG028_09620 [Terriglobia bacterium]|nr:hypothetical protein [Terriglobia bacterium]